MISSGARREACQWHVPVKSARWSKFQVPSSNRQVPTRDPMDPKIVALIVVALLLICWAVVKSDRALTQESKEKRAKHYDSHGHE